MGVQLRHRCGGSKSSTETDASWDKEWKDLKVTRQLMEFMSGKQQIRFPDGERYDYQMTKCGLPPCPECGARLKPLSFDDINNPECTIQVKWVCPLCKCEFKLSGKADAGAINVGKGTEYAASIGLPGENILPLSNPPTGSHLEREPVAPEDFAFRPILLDLYTPRSDFKCGHLLDEDGCETPGCKYCKDGKCTKP